MKYLIGALVLLALGLLVYGTMGRRQRTEAASAREELRTLRRPDADVPADVEAPDEVAPVAADLRPSVFDPPAPTPPTSDDADDVVVPGRRDAEEADMFGWGKDKQQDDAVSEPVVDDVTEPVPADDYVPRRGAGVVDEADEVDAGATEPEPVAETVPEPVTEPEPEPVAETVPEPEPVADTSAAPIEVDAEDDAAILRQEDRMDSEGGHQEQGHLPPNHVEHPHDIPDTPAESAPAGESPAEDGGDLEYDEAHHGWSRRVSSLEEIRDGGYGVGSAAPFDDRAMPLGHPVKAWEDTKTFVDPSHRSYEDAEPHVWFTDSGAAERAGFRPVG